MLRKHERKRGIKLTPTNAFDLDRLDKDNNFEKLSVTICFDYKNKNNGRI